MAEMPDRGKVNGEIHRIIGQYRNGTGAIPPLAVEEMRRDLVAFVDATVEDALNYASGTGPAASREG
jgi:uncharacterized Tic20 family protein